MALQYDAELFGRCIAARRTYHDFYVTPQTLQTVHVLSFANQVCAVVGEAMLPKSATTAQAWHTAPHQFLHVGFVLSQ